MTLNVDAVLENQSENELAKCSPWEVRKWKVRPKIMESQE